MKRMVKLAELFESILGVELYRIIRMVEVFLEGSVVAGHVLGSEGHLGDGPWLGVVYTPRSA